jgi:tetratricopeptide (TPR) repeat protein
MRRFMAILLLGAVGTSSHQAGQVLAAEEGEPLLGPTLSTLFNPRSAPTQKTMGLLQRSFLDLVEESRPKLQIALVVDGTDSMSGQLESVRQSLAAMMNDLELYKENNISYQLVVYRDAGAPSGEVVLPVKAANNGFVSDRTALAEAINNVKSESGAPYFPELIDQGLHTALSELNWATDDDTSRWIFLFGDAPPFDESFDEPANKASRRYGTGALVSLAADKGVRINCILCTSDPEDREAQDKLLDQTRRFMSTVSTRTGGLMLDLSYEDIREAVRNAAPARTAEYEKIGVIRKDDIDRVRHETEAANSLFSAGRRLRVAILPHLPLDRMSFDPGDEAVQLATELRLRMRAIPGIEFKDAPLIKDRYRWVSDQGVQGDAFLQMLASALNVDYVMWGTLNRTGGAVDVSTAIYRQTDGRRLAQAKAATNPNVQADQLGALLADNLVKSNAALVADQRLRTLFASAAQNASRSSVLAVPVALGGARSSLLEGMEALEQSLALPVGAPEAAAMLDEARSNLARAIEADADNPLARFLLASALFNQARAKQQAGDLAGARAQMTEFAKQLREAFRLRDRRKDDVLLRTEIEADYALLIRGNTDEAIKLYRRLLDEAQGVDAQAARRGWWMLAGIMSGDWGVEAKFVNQEEAKRCLTQILALWPDSSEAEFIRRAMRWDENDGQTRFPHFPKDNGELADMVDRSA